MFDFKTIYAKSDGETTLEIHTKAVVEAGLRLLDSLPLSADEKSKYIPKVTRIAVLHDLGKVHRFFQQNLLENKKFKIRHELFSFLFGYNYLQLDYDELFAIITHHKGVQTTYEEKGRLHKSTDFNILSQLYEHDKNSINYSVLKQWLKLNNLDCRNNQLTELEKPILKKQQEQEQIEAESKIQQEVLIANQFLTEKLTFMGESIQEKLKDVENASIDDIVNKTLELKIT